MWSDVIDPNEAVPRSEFTARAANTLKAGTHIALFGPRGTGKTTFIGQLAEELALDHGADAPSPGSEKDARHYGLPDNRSTMRALQRLRDRGYVTRSSHTWRIVDPLLAAWLQTQNPLGED